MRSLAAGYRVSTDSIRRARNGKQRARNGTPAPSPSLADLLANATAAERREAAARLGPAEVWDTMVSPLLDQARVSQA